MGNNLDILKNGILSGNRTALAKAITLIENQNPKKFEEAQNLISLVQEFSGSSFRIGITGAPGVGKSTFIDSLGLAFINEGHKVAVLAIDPSSSIAGGSILGDKTRMAKLNKEADAFVRPSPAAGELGGLSQKTQETILLCEAAGYNIILIETVGVGQSETAVSDISDLVIYLTIPETGDELQGIKRGVMEIVDIFVINKSDVFTKEKLNDLKNSFKASTLLFRRSEQKPPSKVFLASSLFQTGFQEIINGIDDFFAQSKESRYFDSRRNLQNEILFKNSLNSLVFNNIFKSEIYQKTKAKYLDAIKNGRISTVDAAAKSYKEIIGNLDKL